MVSSNFKPFTHFCCKLANAANYVFFASFLASKTAVAIFFWTNFNSGHIVPPHVTYLWISVQIGVQTHERNLILLSREFGKGQYTLYHMKSSLFAKKNELRKKCWNFIRWKGEPLQSRSTTPSTPLEYWICSSKPGQIGLKLFKRKSPCP